jgi:hypothetical protein
LLLPLLPQPLLLLLLLCCTWWCRPAGIGRGRRPEQTPQQQQHQHVNIAASGILTDGLSCALVHLTAQEPSDTICAGDCQPKHECDVCGT